MPNTLVNGLDSIKLNQLLRIRIPERRTRSLHDYCLPISLRWRIRYRVYRSLVLCGDLFSIIIDIMDLNNWIISLLVSQSLSFHSGTACIFSFVF